jgi:hypothetical protein
MVPRCGQELSQPTPSHLCPWGLPWHCGSLSIHMLPAPSSLRSFPQLRLGRRKDAGDSRAGVSITQSLFGRRLSSTIAATPRDAPHSGCGTNGAAPRWFFAAFRSWAWRARGGACRPPMVCTHSRPKGFEAGLIGCWRETRPRPWLQSSDQVLTVPHGYAQTVAVLLHLMPVKMRTNRLL